MSKIIFDGDRYRVAYMLSAQSAGRQHFPRTQIFPISVGPQAVMKFAEHLLRLAKIKNASQVLGLRKSSARIQTDKVCNLLHVGIIGKIPDFNNPGQELPCIRVLGDSEAVSIEWSPDPEIEMGQEEVACDDVLVNWISSEPAQMEVQPRKGKPLLCRYYVQVGTRSEQGPEKIPTATEGRILISSLNEHQVHARIRKGLSYEAVVVDILRLLRGTDQEPTCPSKGSRGYDFRRRIGWLKETSTSEKTVFVFRLNNAAVLVYRANTGKYDERSYLIYWKNRAAPLDIPSLGRMQGYASMLGAHIATELFRARNGKKGAAGEITDGRLLDNLILQGVQESLIRQAAFFQRGFFHLFFNQESGSKDWQAKTTADWKNHANWFFDLEKATNSIRDESQGSPVEVVGVPIFLAVSRRKLWFITSSLLESYSSKSKKRPEANGRSLHPMVLKENHDAEATLDDFEAVAMHWLTGQEQPHRTVPIVRIGELQLIDRREIEDYLAIQQALTRYSQSSRARPLNIAVFGPPGSGKSFGVTEIARYTSGASKGFSENPLTFNVGQFTKHSDLVSALHRVRDEGLKGKIPIVFFDEFDSSADGQAFGWLKHFLAPMQDGQFMDGGFTFHLGGCVLVFAGGVNRSFEEMNGRLRNQSFYEAKGPDFISRLRGHLNVHGINKPEDEADNGRYILRRGLMLHHIVQRVLAVSQTEPFPLMETGVAAAFSKVGRFKHGYRSMEAILNMCDIRCGKTLSPSDLPSKAQLQMHVEAGEFLAIMSNPRFERRHAL